MAPVSAFRVDCVVGARPNFVKIAPIMRELGRRPRLAPRLIHTGQHYDVAMNAVFFEELGIPAPDIDLEVGSGSGTEQTARIMLGLEPVLLDQRPDMLLVVGDVNSTLAASLVAAKLLIPLVHVEAGLRSNDRTMPEEINRLVTDRLADLLLVTERSGHDNLLREGVDPGRIRPVGNVMIDTLHACLKRAHPVESALAEIDAPGALKQRALAEGFVFATLHRPANVDDRETLAAILLGLAEISRRAPVVLPLHPRTQAMVERFRLVPLLKHASFLTGPPVSYLRAIGLMRHALLVVTDSGGVQEETTALGVPCLTVRDSTERPITVEEGTNTLVAANMEALTAAAFTVLDGGGKRGRVPELWDGRAAVRIADEVEKFLLRGSAPPVRVNAI